MSCGLGSSGWEENYSDYTNYAEASFTTVLHTRKIIACHKMRNFKYIYQSLRVFELLCVCLHAILLVGLNLETWWSYIHPVASKITVISTWITIISLFFTIFLYVTIFYLISPDFTGEILHNSHYRTYNHIHWLNIFTILNFYSSIENKKKSY